VAVFDLGGGTFDFTVLHMFKGVFEVEATGGDSLLAARTSTAESSITWRSRSRRTRHRSAQGQVALQRLRDASEKAKCELSSVKQVEINLPFISASPQSGPLHCSRRSRATSSSR